MAAYNAKNRATRNHILNSVLCLNCNMQNSGGSGAVGSVLTYYTTWLGFNYY